MDKNNTVDEAKAKKKKTWLIVLITLDVVITVFLLIIAIIVLVETNGKTAEEIKNATGFIGYLQNHTTFYFCLFVLPLFLLLAADIVGLVFFVRKQTKSEPVKVADLTEEQKDALKKQLYQEMMAKEQEKAQTENTEKTKEEDSTEESASEEKKE